MSQRLSYPLNYLSRISWDLHKGAFWADKAVARRIQEEVSEFSSLHQCEHLSFRAAFLDVQDGFSAEKTYSVEVEGHHGMIRVSKYVGKAKKSAKHRRA